VHLDVSHPVDLRDTCQLDERHLKILLPFIR